MARVKAMTISMLRRTAAMPLCRLAAKFAGPCACGSVAPAAAVFARFPFTCCAAFNRAKVVLLHRARVIFDRSRQPRGLSSFHLGNVALVAARIGRCRCLLLLREPCRVCLSFRPWRPFEGCHSLGFGYLGQLQPCDIPALRLASPGYHFDMSFMLAPLRLALKSFRSGPSNGSPFEAVQP